LSCDKDAVYWNNGICPDMEARRAVLVLVMVVTGVMIVRGIVAVWNGEIGTVGRQVGIGAVVLAFGVALVRDWDQVGQ